MRERKNPYFPSRPEATLSLSPTSLSSFNGMHFLLLLLLVPFFPLVTSSSYPYGKVNYQIDCGSAVPTVDSFRNSYVSDRFFSGGSPAIVSEPLHFRQPQEKTLRYFPLSSGKKNCYSFPDLPPGRYLVRTFTVYDNYDGKSNPPSFDASVAGTIVFSWRSPWPLTLARDGAYSDLLAPVDSTGLLELCFYSIATDPPVIGSISVVQVDPQSYYTGSAWNGSILVNYGRLDCGIGQWGPGFSNDTDLFYRSWQSEYDYRTASMRKIIDAISTASVISGAEKEPNYFPMKLYQTAVTSSGTLEYELQVDAKLDYMLWLHFAEIDQNVRKSGARVFNVVVNGEKVTQVDIYARVGGFAAYDWSYVVRNLSSSILSVRLVPVVGSPLLSGIENYAMVPLDLSTDPQQLTAMRSLKELLRIPDRMGWNGDPCAPTNWDAWEGVTCHNNANKTALVIYQLDLGSQGLKGFISDQISVLTNLVRLNLSSNSLRGSLPAGLGQKSLVRLDLSNNQLTGAIPDSLSSSNLQLVLLNNNLLVGRVPEEIYSIGVHGGEIDLSDNKGLCGVPSLPTCPMFWDHKGLSSSGKVAIALSCTVVFCVLSMGVYCCIRRRRNDYDFALPQELMGLSAKRNRYQRQKSLMHLEMESQHAKALTSNYSPS